MRRWIRWWGSSSTRWCCGWIWSGDPSAAQVLEQVRQRSLGALEHQDVPFEVLVDRLKPVRSLAHHPLVQVGLAWQNFSTGAVAESVLGEARVSPLSVDTHVARMDLTFSLSERWDEAGEAGWDRRNGGVPYRCVRHRQLLKPWSSGCSGSSRAITADSTAATVGDRCARRR